MLSEPAGAAEMPLAQTMEAGLTVRPHYITQDGRQLFAWHHSPRRDGRRGAAVVLCPPLGSDYICAYRAWRILAERLAAIGFDVLRFDYEGTGDSAGDLAEHGRVAAWLRNIEAVVTEARMLAGSGEIALVGLRIGATLAVQAAVARGGVERLVLWSPFSSGRAYVRELKALAQLSHKDFVTPEGPDILAAGYVLPAAIARELEAVDLKGLSIPPAPDVLLVDRDDRSPDTTIARRLESLGPRVARVQPAGTGEMLERAGSPTLPDAALDAIISWLADWPSRGNSSASLHDAGTGSSELSGPGYHERGVRFGQADRLFGILCVPNHARGAAPAIILLNTGLEYRVGPHRLYVPVARELAALGHLVLRYDLGGIGDSPPPPGALENVAYPPHALDDAREAIAFMRKQAPGRRLIVAGLCSGGWHAFCAAREGLQVDAILAVNAPLYLRDGVWPTIKQWIEYQEIGNYRSKLRDPARWVNALRGRAAYGYFARFAASYVRQKVGGRIASVFGSRLLDGLVRDLDGIRARGITSLFVFSRGDAGLEYFKLHAGPAFLRRKARKSIRYVVVDAAGHTFSPPEAQQALRQILLDFVKSQTPRDPAQCELEPRFRMTAGAAR